MSRKTALTLAVPAVLIVTAAARPYPDSVPLPDDFSPEGIAVGTGSTFYVGSVADGDIYRGDLRSGDGAVFVDAPPGRVALGIDVDEPRHRLFVAGAITGHAYVYDSRDGTPLADLELPSNPVAFVNDVEVTDDAAYFTDSLNPSLYRVPISPDGTLGEPEPLALTGPAAAAVGFPGLNGIDSTPDGTTLVVSHTVLGAVYTVDPVTGTSQEIQLSGGPLTAGTVDGVLLDGRTLWVVENFANRLVEIRLSPDLSAGSVVSITTNDDVDGRFRVPTAVAGHGNRLALVNARFDIGIPPPLGSGVPAGTDYDVVLVDKH